LEGARNVREILSGGREGWRSIKEGGRGRNKMCTSYIVINNNKRRKNGWSYKDFSDVGLPLGRSGLPHKG